MQEADIYVKNYRYKLSIIEINRIAAYCRTQHLTISLPKIRFHDLRLTYASLLIEQGENIKYIQNQRGHSNPTVTLNVYAHLMKPINQEAAIRLEKAVFETSGSKMVAINKKGETL